MLDLIIIGGGPAGLSAAINASSEGLKVALIERGKIGGQIAGTSLVENFFGFPHGVSGSDVAQWGEAQACKFGCQVISGEVLDIKRDGYYAFRLEVVGKGGNTSFRICRAVLYAGGLNYTRIPEFSQWEGDKAGTGDRGGQLCGSNCSPFVLSWRRR
jgi:thioredoxin reductase (NADPH)